MARSRRRRPQPITDRIVRIYEVIIWPDESDDGPYEPQTITLSWPADRVPEPYTDKVKRDALKQARKEEVKAGRLDVDSPTVFSLESIRMVKASLIKAADTYEGGAPRQRVAPPELKVGDTLVLRNGRFEPA